MLMKKGVKAYQNINLLRFSLINNIRQSIKDWNLFAITGDKNCSVLKTDITMNFKDLFNRLKKPIFLK